MTDKLYVVSYVEDYDTYECSYHRTRKGALKYIMQRQYEHWELCRYVSGYNELFFSIREKELSE